MSATVDNVDELRDVRLWQALEYAPDHNAAPDWRLRKAILKRAGDAVGAVDPYEAEAELELAARPWWRRIGSSGEQRSRLPWAAALAILLFATLVTMFWRRDPVVAPQRDAEPKVAAAPAPQARDSNGPALPGLTESGPSSSQTASRPSSSAPPSTSSSALLPSTALPEPPPLPVAAPSAPVASAAPAPSVKLQQKTPSPTMPPPPPRRESVDAAAKPVPPTVPAVSPQASADVARTVPAPAPAPSPSVRTEATEPPTFAALSQWTRMTIARRGGGTRTVQRAEARDLNALLGSAAISAVGSQPMRAAPEYRVTLERNGDVLAVFEVAPTQVRWREGKTPSATGVPSAPALAALREALRDTLQPAPTAAPAYAPPRNP